MHELNSTDFEYDCSDDSFRDDDEKRNRIKKLLEYRYQFYKLFLDNLGIDYKEDDVHIAINLIYNYDYNRLTQPLCFKFNCCLYHDVEEIALELDKFKLFFIESMKDLAKGAGNEALAKGIIRDSNGKDRTDVAFRVMEKALTASRMKRDGCSNKTISNNIYGKNPYGENIEKEKDHINLYLKYARILMERVKNGTFPYNKNGVWKLT